jgi:tellurite resistance protein TehA-like permease
MNDFRRDAFWSVLFTFLLAVAIYALVKHVTAPHMNVSSVVLGVLWVVIIGALLFDYAHRAVKEYKQAKSSKQE